MRASVYVGRIGGLAVALGVGAALGMLSVGVAGASTEESTEASAQTESAATSGTRAGASGSAARSRAGRPTAEQPAGGRGFTGANSPRGSVAKIDSDRDTVLVRVDSNESNLAPKARTVVPSVQVPAHSAEDRVVLPVAASAPAEVMPAAPVVTGVVPSAPEAAAEAPVMVPADSTTGVVEAVDGGWSGLLPGGPGEAAASWAVAAAARRDFRLARAATAAGVPADTTEVAAAVADVNPIAALFFNSTPFVASWGQTGQGGDGVVRGQIRVDDADGDTQTYTVAMPPTRGSVVVASDGSYAYTPDPSFASTGTWDSFTVTVSDAASGFHLHGLGGLLNLLSFGLLGDSGHTGTALVGIEVTPFQPGGSITVDVSSPNPWTGVVTGSIWASNPGGRTLTFGGSTTTAKGAVSINASSGAFVYTPTAQARHAAARIGAPTSETTDSFTITINDGTGRTTSVPVTVAIGSTNSAPVVGAVELGSPSGDGYSVMGSVSASDPDGDRLYYNFPQVTPKGSVFHNYFSLDEGSFVYTATEAAVIAAASPNATQADKFDTFTITITDGYGGMTAVPITVPVGGAGNPPNTAPVAGITAVGTPDPLTGEVKGQVNATDADGDTLSFSFTTGPLKGSVEGGMRGGEFTYIPTAIARQNASEPTATAADKTDSFAVSITDSRGASTVVVVTVPVRPFDVVQGNETYTAGASIPVGMSPQRVAVNPVNGRVYVTNLLTNSVSVIDAANNSVIREIAVGKSPGPLAFSPNGARLYVGNQDGNYVSVVSADTDTVVANIGVGYRPSEVAVSPNGSRLYVTNYTSGSLSVIDTVSNTVLKTVDLWPLPAGGLNSPSGLAVSPDGSKIFVGGSPSSSSNSLGRISVIDASTITVVRSFDVPDAVLSLVLNPAGTRLYLAGVASRVTVVDTATATVVAEIPTGSPSSVELALSPNGTRLYAAAKTTKTMTVIDTATNQVVTTLGLINYPNGLAVGPGGNRIYVAIEGSGFDQVGRNTVSVITRSG